MIASFLKLTALSVARDRDNRQDAWLISSCACPAEERAGSQVSLAFRRELPDSTRTVHLQCWQQRLCCRLVHKHRRVSAPCWPPLFSWPLVVPQALLLSWPRGQQTAAPAAPGS